MASPATRTLPRCRMSAADAPTIRSCTDDSSAQRPRVTSQCARSAVRTRRVTVLVRPGARLTRWKARSCRTGILSREVR